MVGDSTIFTGLCSSTWDRVYVHVKVCDVFPDGTATLVSKSNYHLSNDRNHFFINKLKPAQSKIYPLKMSLASHCFKPGHRVSISIAPSAFPYMWPSCSKDEVYFLPGSSYFVFEKISLSYVEQNTVFHPPPKPLVKLHTEIVAAGKNEKERYEKDGVQTIKIMNDRGRITLPTMGITHHFIDKKVFQTDKTVSYGSAENTVCYHEYATNDGNNAPLHR